MSLVNGRRPVLRPEFDPITLTRRRVSREHAKGEGKKTRRERKRMARTVRQAQYVQHHILAFGLATPIDMSKSARDRFAHAEAMARKYTTTGTTA